MFFKFLLNNFAPKSPNHSNAYNSMADYYEAQNDISNAIIFTKFSQSFIFQVAEIKTINQYYKKEF